MALSESSYGHGKTVFENDLIVDSFLPNHRAENRQPALIKADTLPRFCYMFVNSGKLYPNKSFITTVRGFHGLSEARRFRESAGNVFVAAPSDHANMS